MEEDNRYEDSGGQILTFRPTSPWAWFYYSVFGVQLIIVSAIIIYRQVVIVSDDPITDTYLAILKDVSPHVPAMAAYSMAFAVTVEGFRMLVDGILEKRYWRGRRKGLEEGREEGREQGREEGREQGREEGREQGREEGRENVHKEVATLISQSPTIQEAIQKAIDSGEIEPPPFLKDIDALNGNHRN